MLDSLKNWKFWTLFVVFFSIPQYMAGKIPEYAAVWKTMPFIILILVAIYFVAKEASNPRMAYVIYPEFKQILVKLNNTEAIVLEDGLKRIELHIVKGKNLWIQDSMVHGSSVVIGAVSERGRSVRLAAGNFFVTKDTTHYVIRWESGDWKISNVLEAK